MGHGEMGSSLASFPGKGRGQECPRYMFVKLFIDNVLDRVAVISWKLLRLRPLICTSPSVP
jgi:hypothetical protein